ncbi:hypothetical protein D7V88_20655 [Corallococcus terminator]|uniref:Carboxypeptidase regulatory-like domain-containing protein n=1 Tax=Corallococcus terminator TaxID=2316733 RepID=A0A3A8IP73_9BACT|nr:hypothetical protein D7V88_20655 [Corallococcus terminator]
MAGASLLMALWLGGCNGEQDAALAPTTPESPAQQSQAVTPLSPLVRGYIAARVGDDQRMARHDVYLPGVKVYLRDLSTGATTQPRETDLSGRFTLAANAKSRFEVCWSAPGFVSGCDTKNAFNVTARMKNVGTVLIPIATTTTTASVWGKVSLADGSRPRKLSPLDSVNAVARLELLNSAGGIVYQTQINNFGEYLLPQVAEAASVTLRARFEQAEVTQPILPAANLAGIPWHQVDLRFGNFPPRVKPLVATDAGGRWTKSVAPGAVVKLAASASDRDGHPLQYLWSLDPGAGTLSATSGTQVQWTLPAVRGLYTARVLVYDGHGGYDEQSLSLRTDGAFVLYSGFVTDLAGTALSAVQVEIITSAGTNTTTTNASGFFRVFARDADRYVFNLRKAGHGPVSQIYDRGITGGRWKMQRATVTVVNPTLAIDLTNQRSSSECPGRPSEQLDWTGKYAAARTPQWQDGKGNILPPPLEQVSLPLPSAERPKPICGPGIRVQIPANGLVDSLGRAPTGNVEIALTTIDLKSAQMPGDFTTRALSGQTLVAQSYGAGTVSITSGNTKYNLKPGVTATVTVAVDPTQLATGAALPPTIPFLYFDETAGVWNEELTATLNAAGTAYVAQAPHFSTFNMDLLKNNQACVRIDSTALADAQYSLEIAIPMPAGAAPVYRTVVIDNAVAKIHALYNLPTNTNIVLVPIRQTGNVPIGTFVVNTGGAQNPTTPNAPVFPYAACSTEVVFEDRVIPPPSIDFLHGLDSFAAIDLDELDVSDPADLLLKNSLEQASQNYYDQVDPRIKRLTLADFKTHNGFPTGEVRAVYANHVDLGFGRDMHCTKRLDFFGQDEVACYVANYGTIDTADSADVEEARLAGTPVATVAMEFSPVESQLGNPDEFDDPQRVVKFYVYDAAGTRVGKANLDNLGTRPIPQLCMVCHNGVYPDGDVPAPGFPAFPDRESVKLGSRFLPFDLQSYEFSTVAGFTKADMQDEMKSLNLNYVVPTAPGTATTELINGWYTGGALIQNEAYVVPLWSNVPAEPLRAQTYKDLVGRSCRTCHISQLDPDLAFNASTQFINRMGSIEARVCVQHVMPHSKKTHDLFWDSVGPHQPGLLQIFGDTYGAGSGWNGQLCGTYVSGGTTPVTTYTSIIQPIWNASCTACHTGGAPPAGLSLAAGVSYVQLFNGNATQSTLDRIEPFSVNNSYVWHKLNNTHLTAPANGSGSQMPLGGGTLPGANLTSISSWINGGALP